MTVDSPERWRLSRAGIFNIWQYDEQVFEFAGGRMLLRGTNGAGKSKTLEMLLPFVLDGDTAAMDATGRRGSGLIWLMTDGAVSGAATRLGYVWVEFARVDDDGIRHTLTCGVGLRLGASARTVDKWFFTTTRPIGPDGLSLSGPSGPLARVHLTEQIGDSGKVFVKAGEFRTHVGRTLFGLESDRYDDLLRLLYWLRRPQVGEDIDPKKIAAMLGQSLPALPDDAVRQVGATLDDLSEFGERIARREAALAGLESFAEVYRGYARGVLADRSTRLVDAAAAEHAAVRDQTRLEQWHTELTEQLQAAELAKREADSSAARNQAMLAELDRSPGANTRRELELLLAAVSRHQESATEAGERARSDTDRAERAAADVRRARDALAHTEAQVRARLDELVDAAAELSAPPLRVPRSSNWAEYLRSRRGRRSPLRIPNGRR